MAAEVYSLATPLPLERARDIVRGALAEGRRRELMPLTVCVLDVGGNLIAMEREDGCGVARLEVAQGKAYGALSLGIGGRTIAGRYKGREAFLNAAAAATAGRFVAAPGGVLVLDGNGQAVGAVGVSGDVSDEDEAAALAGLSAAGLKAGVDPAAD
ncbi:MAG TPA: heme-binding protein [Gammaproteobacteria bacterium]|nr:heme-binding protein [Gammaproteobacteria bacterium]